MQSTHPQLCNCQDKIELSCHCTARYKMEWIYTRTKASGRDSLELDVEMRKKEERMRNGLFFKYLVLACTIVLMNDFGLARKFTKLPVLRYLGICNALHIIWHIQVIPTYRVYRLCSAVNPENPKETFPGFLPISQGVTKQWT